MSEFAKIDSALPESEVYAILLQQADEFIKAGEPLLTVLANITALLNEALPKISWCGFYLASGNTLWLGPFQGKVACTVIPFSRGVCGAAATEKKAVIVPDVHAFPGHIACDSGSNSEIVVPLLRGTEVLGVLDLDSYSYAAFSAADAVPLARLCAALVAAYPAAAFRQLISLNQ